MVTQCSSNNVTLHVYKANAALNGSNDFCSGNEIIDKFVRKNLKAHATSPGSAVTVLLDNNNKQRLIGFFTLVTHTLSRESLTRSEKSVGKTPNIPVLKLNMLGVSKEYQKKGYGEQLMRCAFDNTKKISEKVGCAGLYLEADVDAVAFYNKLGFIALDAPDENTGNVQMFLHLDLIP